MKGQLLPPLSPCGTFSSCGVPTICSLLVQIARIFAFVPNLSYLCIGFSKRSASLPCSHSLRSACRRSLGGSRRRVGIMSYPTAPYNILCILSRDFDFPLLPYTKSMDDSCPCSEVLRITCNYQQETSMQRKDACLICLVATRNEVSQVSERVKQSANAYMFKMSSCLMSRSNDESRLTCRGGVSLPNRMGALALCLLQSDEYGHGLCLAR